MSPTPPFTAEHETLRESIRRFVANELRPHAAAWEEARWFPDEVFAKLAAVGILGLKYPEQYGGQGGDYLHDAVFAEEMARCGSGGLAAGVGTHVGIATPPVWKFGTEDQKRGYLAPATAGEKVAALAITEPGTGSDVTYITNGVRAGFYEIERTARDARLGPIGGGTDEVMKEILGKVMGLQVRRAMPSRLLHPALLAAFCAMVAAGCGGGMKHADPTTPNAVRPTCAKGSAAALKAFIRERLPTQ